MRLALAAFPLLALAACGSEPEPVETPSPTPTAAAGPRTLVAAGFNDQELGPRIVGPDGEEVTSTITTADGTVMGEMVSHVACPAPESDAEMPAAATPSECNPADQPEGAVYTYVHRITLGEPDAEATDETPAPPETMVFRMTMPASGFANVVGYDMEQATQTLGEDGGIRVQLDDGMLTWRVTQGDGWMAGETLTFFWQSTLPPEGPANAYELRIDGDMATITGPFPPEEEPEGEDTAG